MSVGKDVLYIKGDQNAEVQNRDVTLGDILSMECTNSHVVSKLKTVRLIRVPENGQHRYVVSILKIIEKIHEEYPGLEIQNLGAQDVIVTYEPVPKKNQFLYWLKVVGVLVITFTGSAFSIMAFNTDVDVPRLFSQFYEQVMGVQKTDFTVLEATSCIGVVIGILVFFNHFGKKRFSVDPTPIEVEMRLYENDIQTTVIENYARKEQELDVGKGTPTGGNRT